MELIVLILVLILFGFAALRWGADSRDGLNSCEWERRQRWYGFH
jgi:hypothetical protein